MPLSRYSLPRYTLVAISWPAMPLYSLSLPTYATVSLFSAQIYPCKLYLDQLCHCTAFPCRPIPLSRYSLPRYTLVSYFLTSYAIVQPFPADLCHCPAILWCLTAYKGRKIRLFSLHSTRTRQLLCLYRGIICYRMLCLDGHMLP
jgi:hypothetical protein